MWNRFLFRGCMGLLSIAACGKRAGNDDLGPGDGFPTGGDASSGTSSSDGSASSGGDEVFDVGQGMGEGGPGDCPGGGGPVGEVEFSLIWIANSTQGTVSKIDTMTGEELARYYTGPSNGMDDPSRTSVNLAGDVAVSNRVGGIAKFAAEEDRCIDRNGNGTIETSSGPNDVLPFNEDECLLWYHDLPTDRVNSHGPRPTAWDAGAGGNPCQPGDDRVWVGWFDFENNTGRFRRLDGTDGSTLDEVSVPDWDYSGMNDIGPYGGAVTKEGDFWVIGNRWPLVRIDGETLDADMWQPPIDSEMYGIALDANGHPWIAGWVGKLIHFDPDTGSFDTVEIPDKRRMRGLQIDREGQAWIAGNEPCALIQVDTATASLVRDDIALPGCVEPVGVSIDVEGFVWLPDFQANMAYKLDPTDYSSTTTEGLVGPYTYSDMTGAGLNLVVNPPTG